MNKNNNHRSGLTTLLILALIAASLYVFFGEEDEKTVEVPITTVQQQFTAGEIEKIKVEGSQLTITLKDGVVEVATRPLGESLSDLGLNDPNSGVIVEAVDSTGSDFWLNVIAGIIPFLLIAAFLVYMMRQAQSHNQGAMSFGQSRATVSDKTKNKTTFADVAGAHEAKEELVEIVDFLKNPKKYTTMGAKIPKGVMLFGPPGTGKTLLARAVAGEANVPFFSISGSEFVEMFVGVGASRVRDLFKKAKRNAPAIVFVDEIDAVGRQRGTGMGGGHDEREQTLNQILTEMDGFETGTNVIVIAATNRPDVLDPALLRPGRFDRRVVIDIPDIGEREEILQVHSRNKPIARDANLQKVARQTPGFTGADLENLLNEAAILAATKGLKTITQTELEKSIEKVALGPEKKSRVLSDDEKKVTAFHEAGHAIVSHALPYTDPVHKISIVSRGMALGVTWYLPEIERKLQSESRFHDELASLLGGHVAEELVFGEVTTGSSNDLERASKLARAMVTQFGMSEKLGPVIYGSAHGSIFIGKDLMHERDYSEEMASKIDGEVKKIIETAYSTAKSVLSKNKAKLKKIAERLLEVETLDSKEFEKLYGTPKATAEFVVRI
ncbi:ATP-dependent zinc metalloprotease FtsH [Candidatus Gracilibacteria bacterium]|nr:ATP-dependent zinc metalloprotease FtsH [Candidatus Gracilibacteria bacterium]MCF7856170.1 ATP-dependent zinc metalloprotease FtsH [Candidatus Gracilibacteria bacterium]MCF7896636.1 ATP-dependent zinc metalloprotease FtsH [Candidatus Gracilibacteria bacterium]